MGDFVMANVQAIEAERKRLRVFSVLGTCFVTRQQGKY